MMMMMRSVQRENHSWDAVGFRVGMKRAWMPSVFLLVKCKDCQHRFLSFSWHPDKWSHYSTVFSSLFFSSQSSLVLINSQSNVWQETETRLQHLAVKSVSALCNITKSKYRKLKIGKSKTIRMLDLSFQFTEVNCTLFTISRSAHVLKSSRWTVMEHKPDGGCMI